MGIYDREYYRDDTGGSGWLSGPAPACKVFILLNVVVYLAQVVFEDAQLENYLAATADGVFHKLRLWELLTANFVHDRNNPFHLIFNMLFLWMAGKEEEQRHGSREFVAMYLTACVVSVLACVGVAEFALGGVPALYLGASGPVIAVLVVYTLYNPRREIMFMFILPIELWLLVIIFLGLDFVFLLNQFHGRAPMVMHAFAGHLGGAAYGYLYKAADLRWARLLPLGRSRSGPRLRVVKPDLYDREMDLPMSPGPGGVTVTPSPASRPAPSVLHADEQFEARLDEVLAKIGREGRDRLTDEENRILQEASRRARDRRSDRVR